MAQPAHVPMLDEIEKQFMTEFDYTREMGNLDKVADNMEKSRQPWSSRVRVPRPIKK